MWQLAIGHKSNIRVEIERVNRRAPSLGLWMTGITATLYFLSLCVFGFHFGWLDDVLVSQVMYGTFSGSPTFNFFENFRLVGHVLHWFYGLNTTINWMGVFLYSLSFFATIVILKIVVEFLRHVGIKWHVSILIGILFYTAFLVENVVFINYTRVAILSMGAGLLLVLHSLQHYNGFKRRVLPIAGLLLFSAGYLIRPEVAPFALSVFAVLLAMLLTGKKEHRSDLLVYSLAVLMIVAVVKIEDHYDNSPQYEEFKRYRPYIVKLLDANYMLDRREMALNESDRTRILAVGLWYYMDKDQVGIQYLDSLTQDAEWELPPVNIWPDRIATQWRHSKRYTAQYHVGYNYHVKLIMYLALSVVGLLFLLLQLLRKQISGQAYLFISLYTLLFPLLVLGMLIVFKMEDRVLTPFFIIHLLGYLILITTYSNLFLVKRTSGLMVVLLLVTSTFASTRVYGLSQEKKTEGEKLHRLIEELNTKFQDKIILYDLWTIGYLHENPFTVPRLDTSRNIHFAFGEYFMSPSDNYSAKAKTICQSDSHLEFFNCLCNKKDDVVFFHSQVRIALLENYFGQLYGKQFKFEKMKEPAVLDSLPYSFLWDPIFPGYYQLKECEEP